MAALFCENYQDRYNTSNALIVLPGDLFAFLTPRFRVLPIRCGNFEPCPAKVANIECVRGF
jgi:hypothetical protein